MWMNIVLVVGSYQRTPRRLYRVFEHCVECQSPFWSIDVQDVEVDERYFMVSSCLRVQYVFN